MLSNNEKILYSGVVVVVVGLGMYMLRQSKTPSEQPKVITYDAIRAEQNSAIAKDKMSRQAVNVKNFQTAPKLGMGIREVKDGLSDTTGGLRLEGEKNHAAVDAADPSVYEQSFTSLENQINRKQVDDQRSAQMSQIQKRNFVESYKKRALAMGYRVELNDRLELVKAEKIPQPLNSFPSAKQPGDVETTEEDIELDEE